MPALVPELADQCVVVNGVAKTYAMTGWRVGWMIGPTDVVKAATNLQSHATSNVANVAQVAALAAVSGDLSAVAVDARGLRPSAPHHGRHAERDPWASPARSRRARSTPTPPSRALLGRTSADTQPEDLGGAGQPDPRRGRGGRGPWRGVRDAGLPAPVLRPRRRGPRRGRQPHPTRCSPRRPTERRRSGRGRSPRTSRAPQGPPAPALHRLDAARHAARAGAHHGLVLPDALREATPRRLSAADERGWFRFQRLYDVARSVIRDEADVRRLLRRGRRGRGCGRVGLAGDPGRPEWLRRSLRRSHRLHRAGARRRVATPPATGGRHRGRHRGEPHPASPGRAHAGPAGRRSTRAAASSASAWPTTSGAAARRTSQRPSPSRGTAGLLAVPHGGELLGADSVRACLEDLHADRVGHGVRAAEDPDAARPGGGAGVTLEVCPTSNVSLGVYTDPASVPLPRAARRWRARGPRRRRPVAVRRATGRAVRAREDRTRDVRRRARRPGADVGRSFGRTRAR